MVKEKQAGLDGQALGYRLFLSAVIEAGCRTSPVTEEGFNQPRSTKKPGSHANHGGLFTFGVCTIVESLIACPHTTQLFFF